MFTSIERDAQALGSRFPNKGAVATGHALSKTPAILINCFVSFGSGLHRTRGLKIFVYYLTKYTTFFATSFFALYPYLSVKVDVYVCEKNNFLNTGNRTCCNII